MKKYAELTAVDRGAPCQEYPGTWLIHLPLPYEGKTEHSFNTLEEARTTSMRIINAFEDAKLEYNPREVTIAWQCSDNDPRLGQVWFTGFYRHGSYTLFGDYRES